jgi:MFS superfamily sulfate permease-like transporter
MLFLKFNKLKVGIFTLVLGLCRFGFLASVLSRPLLAGFINAIALEVILEQSDKFFGVSADSHSYLKVPDIIEDFSEVFSII